MSQKEIEELMVKKHTFREKVGIVRLQLVLHEDTAFNMRRFITTLIVCIATIAAIIISGIVAYTSAQDTIVIPVFLTLGLLLEIWQLFSLRHYRPTAVYKRMIRHHDYGVNISAIRHTNNRAEVPF